MLPWRGGEGVGRAPEQELNCKGGGEDVHPLVLGMPQQGAQEPQGACEACARHPCSDVPGLPSLGSGLSLLLLCFHLAPLLIHLLLRPNEKTSGHVYISRVILGLPLCLGSSPHQLPLAALAYHVLSRALVICALPGSPLDWEFLG